ncbi:Hypothetical_protein [Hexamita inflata]|uniref:Hypothetical_protein n=1 Tax=Hexamita inflata TaxID=28002 RepID=A0AA86PFZ8_9EUKA|nr:Hypothetical protein HINF_LOCUS25091 [Hexamita inflata]
MLEQLLNQIFYDQKCYYCRLSKIATTPNLGQRTNFGPIDSTKYRALQPIPKDTLTELKSVFKRDLKINLQFQISDIQDNRRFSLLYFQQLCQEKYPIDYDENMFVTMMYTGPADDEDAQIRQENESPVVQPFIEPEQEVIDVSSDEEEERAVGVIRNSFLLFHKDRKQLNITRICQAPAGAKLSNVNQVLDVSVNFPFKCYLKQIHHKWITQETKRVDLVNEARKALNQQPIKVRIPSRQLCHQQVMLALAQISQKTIIHGFEKTRLLCSITPYVPKNLFIAMDAINETGFLNQTEEHQNLWENFDIPEEVLVNILFPPEDDGEAYE